MKSFFNTNDECFWWSRIIYSILTKLIIKTYSGIYAGLYKSADTLTWNESNEEREVSSIKMNSTNRFILIVDGQELYTYHSACSVLDFVFVLEAICDRRDVQYQTLKLTRSSWSHYSKLVNRKWLIFMPHTDSQMWTISSGRITQGRGPPWTWFIGLY